jgi:hypothetical protein
LGGCRHWRGGRTRSRSAGIFHIIGVIVRIPPPPPPCLFPQGIFLILAGKPGKYYLSLGTVGGTAASPRSSSTSSSISISSSSPHGCTGDHRAGLTACYSRDCMFPQGSPRPRACTQAGWAKMHPWPKSCYQGRCPSRQDFLL